MEIDSVILMAKCIKKIDGDKNIGNIDQLIASLESHRDNVGDVSKQKKYRLLIITEGKYSKDSYKVFPIIVQTRELTSKTIKKIEDYVLDTAWNIYDVNKESMLMCNATSEDEIYDYIYDIESYHVSHELEVELYRNGFNYSKIWDERCRYIKDDDEYHARPVKGKCCSQFYLESSL